ncbi:MAG: Rnf-Nqr domain containing protein [Acutalibacteraceae bacterium]
MRMTWFFDLLSTALYTVFIQNLVFNGGFAMSEALMLAKKPRRLWMFSGMIAFFSTITALVCRAIEFIPQLSALPTAIHFAIFSGVLITVYLITGIVLKVALGATEKFLATLGMAALNTLVLAIPLLNRSAAYTLPESIGTGIGAGAAFILAATLICKGMHIISQNQDLPKAFRGTPAAFVYVALLSLAFSGFSGGALFS